MWHLALEGGATAASRVLVNAAGPYVSRVLRDVAQNEVSEREQIVRITAGRIANGLDTEVERKTAEADLASSRATLSALDGRIVATRYQIAASEDAVASQTRPPPQS